jgi:hypothetical protein
LDFFLAGKKPHRLRVRANDKHAHILAYFRGMEPASCLAIVVRPAAPGTRVAPRPLVLPLDVVKNILEFCRARDLARAACVCKRWRRLASQDMFWNRHVFVDWNLSPHEFKPPRPVAKTLYVCMVKSWRASSGEAVEVY